MMPQPRNGCAVRGCDGAESLAGSAAARDTAQGQGG